MEPRESSSGVSDSSVGSPPRLVLIDDNEIERRLNTDVLRRAGFGVMPAENAAMGLALCGLHHPEIAVVDYRLPDMDGLDFLAQLPTVSDRTVAVMLTGEGDENVAVEALKRGAKDYLIKGQCAPATLASRVGHVWQGAVAERELRRVVVRREAMIRALPDAVLRVSRDGRVLEQGSRPVAPGSVSPPEMQRLTLDGLFGLQAGSDLLAAVSESLERRITARMEFSHADDGILFHYDANVASCGDDEALIVIRDVTESRQVRRRLEEALEAAREASKTKSAFLANMSHEIRTPMNGVLGAAELLSDTELSEEQCEHLSMILHSGKALMRILDDILDTAKIEAGRLDLEEIPYDFRKLLRTTVAMVEVNARDRNNAITTSVAQELPRQILGDPTRVQQVLLNYLSNANKFTEDGQIEVRAVVTGSESGERLTCHVRDTGVGIEPAKLERLFKPFSQVDASTRRRYGGTGLGLALCKQLCELMGGGVSVDTELGRGSTFSFEVPLRPAEAESEEPRNISPVPGGPLRVLVAEDNLINQKVTARLLERMGHEYCVVQNGEEAVRRVESDEFDVVLMDCHMPELDGYEATRRIRALPEISGLRIVALTASAMSEDRELAREAGMDDFVSKPVSRRSLTRALRPTVRRTARSKSKDAP